jgi:glycerophosphoryl diester phosphodiesterase
VLLLGHRGQVCSAEAPENTAAAIVAALDGGADGVEVDVRLTAEGVPVCIHDPDLRRVAWSGRQIAMSTYADLLTVRLPGGQRVPTLAEVVALVANRGLLVLDLKLAANATALAAAVVEVLRRSGRREEVVLSSFAPEVLTALRRCASQLPRALITGGEVPAVVALSRARAAGCTALHPYVRTVLADHGVVERAARQGIVLRCWTVNRPVDARLLDIAGVPAVISDDPACLRRALATPTRDAVG